MSVFSQSPIQVTPDTPVNSTWWNNQVYTKLIEIDNFLSNPNNFVPSGIIVMWTGSIASIPTGWALADGTGGRPDLRDRFIVGAGSSYAVGAIGGEAVHTLTHAELPTTVATRGDTYYSGSSVGSGYANRGFSKTNLPGGGTAHENRPPYYALCFIVKE